jgi:radical SAM superfamily enzyme YgiQ (UPF0313 family)
MSEIIREKLKVRLGFQGVRIDTFDSLSDHDLNLLHQAGGRFLQFGVESGSPRILEMINKKIKVNQVLSLNRRLAAYPHFIPYYNFMCGFPGETKQDLFQTTSLAWSLLRENRNAIISPFHHYKPYPGTSLCDNMLKQKSKPETLRDWGHYDWTGLIEEGQEKSLKRQMKNIEFSSILVDGKLQKQADSLFWAFLAKVYRPIARLRFKHNFFDMMPEARFYEFLGRRKNAKSRI